MRQEEKQEDCRLSLLCEAALPQAISVSLSLFFSLHSSLHQRFKQKARSLKGRIFNQMRWPPGAPCHQAHHGTEMERGENELRQQQCEETSTVCLQLLCRGCLRLLWGLNLWPPGCEIIPVNFRPSCLIIQHNFSKSNISQTICCPRLCCGKKFPGYLFLLLPVLKLCSCQLSYSLQYH